MVDKLCVIFDSEWLKMNGGNNFYRFCTHTYTYHIHTHTQTIFDQRLAYAIPFFFFLEKCRISKQEESSVDQMQNSFGLPSIISSRFLFFILKIKYTTSYAF